MATTTSQQSLLDALHWRYATKSYTPPRRSRPMSGRRWSSRSFLPATPAVVVAALGCRAADDKYASAPKVRFSSQHLLVTV